MFYYIYILFYSDSQSTDTSSTWSQEPLAQQERGPLFWQDDRIPDTGAPDVSSLPFKPVKQPGVQLGRVTR
jgi:hypothetical protein